MNAIVAALLAFFIGSALAQAPPTVPPVPDAPRISSYNVTSPTSTFNVGFPVYGDCTDLIVTQNGAGAAVGSDFSCASASGLPLSSIARPITDLNITFNTPIATGPVVIQSLCRPRNLVVPTAPGISRTEFERTINSAVSCMRDLYQAYGTAFPLPAVYGVWSGTVAYPPNAVVSYGGQIWQAIQTSVGATPSAGSAYWSVLTNPPVNLSFTNTQLPGLQTAISAATTTDLGTLATHFASITGSGVTIASFGNSCSPGLPLYWATFQGANTLTYNATSMILPGQANITTVTGDTAVMQCLGSGNWAVISYTAATPANAVPSGALMAFKGTACPSGWQVADGTNGTLDARGVVVRGMDQGRGLDPGRAVGAFQADQLHTFTVNTFIPQGNGSGSVASVGFSAGLSNAFFSSSPTGTTFGTETRVKNVAALYCQKL